MGEVGECAFDEAGHGRGGLVVVALDVGDAGVVVEDRVDEALTNPCLAPHPVA